MKIRDWLRCPKRSLREDIVACPGIFMLPAVPVLALILLLAAALRLPDLSARPMHADEAVLADKFGTLLEKGRYEYDPKNHHGPALLYLTLPAAWLSGARRYTELTETTLRLAPALCGLALVALPLVLWRALTRRVALAAAFLTALSPALVYYSRYYIPETLLVCLSFAAIACGWRCVHGQRLAWALLTGACLGLMYATKETALIAFAAMGAAALLSQFGDRQRNPQTCGWTPPAAKPPGVTLPVPELAAAVTAVLVLVAVNPRGVIEMPSALRAYTSRAAADPFHLHPWYFYFQLLRGEAAIAVLAVCGAVAGWRRTDAPLLRFLVFYTAAMTVAYAAIPYKTPWCLLGFWHAWILLAAVGAVWLAERAPRATAVALLITALHLGWQAWQGSRRYAADPRNPYVYAHATRDVFIICDRLERFGRDTPIQVISRTNLWPLPWYLRSFTRVQWWNAVPEDAPAAPVILATPDMEAALARKLYELPPPGERPLYAPFLYPGTELRPGVELRGYSSVTGDTSHISR